jgi:hypothetical protein
LPFQLLHKRCAQRKERWTVGANHDSPIQTWAAGGSPEEYIQPQGTLRAAEEGERKTYLAQRRRDAEKDR